MGYLPHTDQDRREMLAAVGVSSLQELFADIPAEVQEKAVMDLLPALTEGEIVRHLQELAALDQHVETRPCFLGAGAYRHFVPSAVDAIFSRGEFATAYTPYQPEASQGTLQAVFEFQSMICALTGLDVANASLYDGGSATAEAAVLCAAATGRKRILVSRAVHPEYREILATYAVGGVSSLGFTVEEIALSGGVTDLADLEARLGSDVAGVIIQDPNFFGVVEGSAHLAERVHAAGALLVSVNNDPTAYGLLRRPASWGVDIAVGEAAAVGVPLSYGGPYVGFIAVRDEFVKRLPGRLVGLTTDQQGRRGFCLTLQTREQHIRRDKATSNICTNQSLCALAVTVYLAALGPQGLREVAEASARRARYTLQSLVATGLFERSFDQPFYHEFVVRTADPQRVLRALEEQQIVGGLALAEFYPEMPDSMLWCATEMVTRADVDRTVQALRAWVG
jgi:glycine dehydrogenase subunit 1